MVGFPFYMSFFLCICDYSDFANQDEEKLQSSGADPGPGKGREASCRWLGRARSSC